LTQACDKKNVAKKIATKKLPQACGKKSVAKKMPHKFCHKKIIQASCFVDFNCPLFLIPVGRENSRGHLRESRWSGEQSGANLSRPDGGKKPDK
jgi:hypothetical protein